MANPRTGIGQIWMGSAYETTFGVANAAQVWALTRFQGFPVWERKSFERGDASQGMWRKPHLWGNTDTDFKFEAMFRYMSTYSYNETGILLKCLLGSQHDSVTWQPTTTFTIDTDGNPTGGAPFAPTATQCEIVVSADISAADIGALLYLPTGHIVRLTAVGAGGGTNLLLTWTPALAAGDVADLTDGGVIKCVRSFYSNGTVDSQSMQFFTHGEDTHDQLLLLGCNGSAVFKIAPSSDKPFCVMDCDFKVANIAKATAMAGTTPAIVIPSALSVAADDAGSNPIPLSAGVNFQLEGYTAGVPDATNTPTQFAEFELDLGWNLQKIEDGNKTNGIAGWKPTKGDGLLKGSLLVPWDTDWYQSAASNVDYHIMLHWGVSSTAMGAIYLSKVNFHKPENADRGGLQMMKIPFTCQQPYDPSVGTTNVAASPIVIGQIG